MKSRLIVQCSLVLCTLWTGDAFTAQYNFLASSGMSRIASRLSDSTNNHNHDHDHNNNNDDDDKEDTSHEPFSATDEVSKQRKREQIAIAAKQLMKRPDSDDEVDKRSSFFNPFKAGQNLRTSLDSALTSLARASSTEEDRQRSPYYLDDRFKESGGALFTQETNPYLAKLEQEKYIPEVLVVGATGEVGRLVVRRLQLEGRSKVRVLVPNLYSNTLNMLGAGVTYCQGDLNNMDSLEYALTDVDKIVMCAAAPRPDEEGFKEKFLGFVSDNLDGNAIGEISSTGNDGSAADMQWERLGSVMEVRAKLAEQVDLIGMQNIVKAYQNVRFADYGTSQAAKRSLFKFQSRPGDFTLFALDDSRDDASSSAGAFPRQKPENNVNLQSIEPKQSLSFAEHADDAYENLAGEYDEYDKYVDDFDKYEDEDSPVPDSSTLVESRRDTSVKTQVKWIRNEFGHGVFVGQVPKATAGGVGGEASIVSSRLRSRDGQPDDGIDLADFGGLVCRVCSDGGNYEAFIRTGAFDRGIEYVCDFSTSSKSPRRGNASRNKFTTIRLPFESFKAVRRESSSGEEKSIPCFQGRDVRYIGFRFRSSENPNAIRRKQKDSNMCSFYLGLSYIKLFRTQPEPEFVYLSDARIPPVVTNSQVRHDIQQLVSSVESSSSPPGSVTVELLNEKELQQISSDKTARSAEETYFKYRGEEVLKSSGLSYAIVRVAGYNELPSSEASTICLRSTDDDIQSVSRREVAEVCVSALLDPYALNKSFYVTKQKGKNAKKIDESMSEKFQSLHKDLC